MRRICEGRNPGRQALALIGAWVLVTPAAAQVGRQVGATDAFLNQQRATRDRIWAQIDQEQPLTGKTAFDYGGSYSFNLFLYDDGVNSSRTLRQNDLRIWGRAQLENGAHQFYVRTLLSYRDFNTGDSIDGNDDDWFGPNLERGFYQFDLRRALAAYGGPEIDYDVVLKVGRDLVEVGTGLAMSRTLDHVALAYSDSNLAVTGLIGRTVGSEPDFDRSRPIDRTRRAFFGLQGEYQRWQRHRPFAYVLWQRDHNDETYPTPLQEYDYDSFYVGFGSRGELIDRLYYSTEWVYESGHSYGNERFRRDNRIQSWALDAQLMYLFDGRTRPRAGIEYIFASGDPDRLGSPTNSYNGNRTDFEDNSFVGFGFRDTGLSFAPDLSNIHIWKMGGSFFPAGGDDRFDRLELGTNWFLYWKNRRSAAVSDPTANRQSGYLGWEMDYFANWAVTTDLSWTVRYGVFFPGQAFSDRTTRTFLVTGFTWSF